MIKGGGGVQTPPKKHDIINEQPLITLSDNPPYSRYLFYSIKMKGKVKFVCYVHGLIVFDS